MLPFERNREIFFREILSCEIFFREIFPPYGILQNYKINMFGSEIP